jgi:hypothetical protein
MVFAGGSKQDCATGEVRQETQGAPLNDSLSLSVVAEHQPSGRHQQQDQGHQALAYGFRDDEYFFLKIAPPSPLFPDEIFFHVKEGIKPLEAQSVR